MGNGQAACLALAKLRGWWIASDEKKAFLQESSQHSWRRKDLHDCRAIGPGHSKKTRFRLIKGMKSRENLNQNLSG